MRDSRIYLHAIDQSQRIEQQQCIIKYFYMAKGCGIKLRLEPCNTY